MASVSSLPAPSPAKLAAWAKVRAVWVAMKKNAYVSPELLDAEWEAKNTD